MNTPFRFTHHDENEMPTSPIASADDLRPYQVRLLYEGAEQKRAWLAALDCPRWLVFLADVFAGDQETIEQVRQAIGDQLTSRADGQRVYLCYGSTTGGKTTFLRLLAALFADLPVAVRPDVAHDSRPARRGAAVWTATNKQPQRGRANVVLLPFLQDFTGRADPELIQTLTAELAAIRSWAAIG